MSKGHVFLSYCRDNQIDVARLRDELIKAGEVVWWDKDDILPGQDWKQKIRKAMRESYAVVVCLSVELQARKQSGVYPELYDAISEYRQQSPNSVFLIPVRLSDCDIPQIEIDDTRTLDSLQFVNLFPDNRRADGLNRLLKALRSANGHPLNSSPLESPQVRDDKSYYNELESKNKTFPSILSAYPKPSLNSIINREEELIEIHDILKNHKFISITGLGGIGKTIFSTLYREKYINEYKHLVWVNCIFNNNDKVNEINCIAKAFYYDEMLLNNLNINFDTAITKNSDFYKEAFGLIINNLNQIQSSSLLIIDNANFEIEQVEIYNKISSLNDNWRILITSREDLSLHFQEYRLNFLSPEQARDLFYLYYKREHNNELVDQIVQIVGLHALTIELLAKTAQANRSLTLDKLKTLLNKEGLNISKAVLVKTTYDKVKVTTYIFDCLTAAFSMVNNLQGSIKKLLIQFSILPPIYISYGDLINYLIVEDSQQDKFIKDLNYLTEKGLISEASEGDSFKCHQVLQGVIRNQFKPTTEDCKVLIKSLTDKLEYDPIANAVEKAKYLSFAASILSSVNEENLQLASLAHNMNDVYDSIGEYQKAIECELKAITIREKLDNNGLDLAQSYNDIGVTYMRQDNFKESLKFHRKALNIRKAILDKHHSDIALSLSCLASVYYGMKNVNRATRIYLLVLNVLQIDVNPDKSRLADIARVYSDLGMCFSELNDLVKSKEYLEKSLEIKRAIYNEPNLQIIITNLNLGSLLLKQEKYYDALNLYEKILKAQQVLYQSENPFIVDTKRILEFIRDKVQQIEIAKN